MKFTLTTRALEQQAKDACIVFVLEKKPLLGTGDKKLAAFVKEQIKKTAFTGDSMQMLCFPTFGKTAAEHIVLAGLGKAAEFQAEYLEQAAAAAVRAGSKAGAHSFVTASAPKKIKGFSAEQFVLLAARGAAWGTYRFDTFKTEKKKRSAEASLLFAGSFDNARDTRQALEEAQIEAAALSATADLANRPGNLATPAKIATWAKKMAEENGLKFRVFNKADLAKQNCNALLSVAQGSANDAKIIVLEYTGTKRAAPLALVGKTITFDSGGLSLKPARHMTWMQYDKSGGMAVLAAMQMVAQLKPERPVLGVLAVAENMPGGSATRPGDIVKSSSGKTIEILNTDAEGRLALCDALTLVQKRKPEAIVDLATLTGAVIGALGHTAAAVVGNNQKLIDALINAGSTGGERLWQLPLWKEHSDDMKGTFADLQNISKSGTAGTATGGAFIKAFVADDIPWAHIDIAGTAWHESEKPWMSPGATLFGARTLIEWIKGMD